MYSLDNEDHQLWLVQYDTTYTRKEDNIYQPSASVMINQWRRSLSEAERGLPKSGILINPPLGFKFTRRSAWVSNVIILGR